MNCRIKNQIKPIQYFGYKKTFQINLEGLILLGQ